MIKQRKTRAQGDRQMRVEDSFDRARHVTETNAQRRQANRCKTDAVIPAGLKPVELPNNLRDRFAPGDDVCSVINSAQARPWALAATA